MNNLRGWIIHTKEGMWSFQFPEETQGQATVDLAGQLSDIVIELQRPNSFFLVGLRIFHLALDQALDKWLGA